MKMSTFIIIAVIVVVGFLLLSPEQQESFKDKATKLFDKFSDNFKDGRVWMGKPTFNCESDADCLNIQDCINCSCDYSNTGECFQIS